MIISQLMGGMGNQMFQYAVGRVLAERNKTQLKLDVSYFENDPVRYYRLNHFNIVENIASMDESVKLAKLGSSIKNRVLRRMEYCLTPYYKRSRFMERSNRFDPNILRSRKDVYLTGYWQSEKYFKDFETIIRQDLSFKHAPTNSNQKMADAIVNCNSVSLHIRRGDYVSNPNFLKRYEACPLEYYKKAITYIAKRVTAPHFFIFSDDMDWAKKNLRLQHTITFVDQNASEKDYEDFRLMSLCKHNIMANSSFSWWGAWLNVFPEKIVIAPKKWITDLTYDTTDLLVDSWHRI